MGFQTDCVSTGEDRQRFYGSIPPPIYQTSLFTFPTYEQFSAAFGPAMEGSEETFIYSRPGNPTVRVLEQKLALLEGAEEARMFASGMAAIAAAVLSCARCGDHVVAMKSIYRNANRLFTGHFPSLGIETSFVDFTDLDAVRAAIRPNTRALYLESPSNPTMQILDIPALAALARELNLTSIIDGTLASPYNQRPLELGVDLVLHSATKYLSGHSDVIAGAVAGSSERMRSISNNELRDLGGTIGPFEAWLTMRGLRTLGLRMRAHNESGLRIAAWLQQRPEVRRVFYPGLPSHPRYEIARRQMRGFSSLLGVVLEGGMERSISFVNRLRLFGIGVSWGGFESLALPIDPVTTWSPEICEATGVVPGFVRLSIGLEDVDDLLCDLEGALTGASHD